MQSPLPQLPTQSSKHWLLEIVKAVGGFTAIIVLGHSGKLDSAAIERCIWIVSIGHGVAGVLGLVKSKKENT